jgi:replicative DNA helicase
LTNVAAKIAENKLFLVDNAQRDIEKLSECIQRQEPDIVFIDSIGYLKKSDPSDAVYVDREEIVIHLKELAQSLNIPVVVTAHTAERIDKSEKRPYFSDILFSSAISRCADVICFLYRDVIYNPETEEPSLAEVIVAKQRYGPVGTIYLEFVKELMMFE